MTLKLHMKTLDGTRQVVLKTDKLLTHQFPHVIYFKSGNKVLPNMTWRPPYCLKCKGIGHTRKYCLKSRGYVAAVHSTKNHNPTPAVRSHAPVPSEAPVSSGPVVPSTEQRGFAEGAAGLPCGDQADEKGSSA